MISVTGATLAGTTGGRVKPGQPFKIITTIQNVDPVGETYLARIVYVTAGGDPISHGVKTGADVVVAPPAWVGRGRVDFEMNVALDGALGSSVDVYVIIYTRCPAKREVNCPYVLFKVGTVTFVDGIENAQPRPLVSPVRVSAPYSYERTYSDSQKTVRAPYMDVDPSEPLAITEPYAVPGFGDYISAVLGGTKLGQMAGIKPATQTPMQTWADYLISSRVPSSQPSRSGALPNQETLRKLSGIPQPQPQPSRGIIPTRTPAATIPVPKPKPVETPKAATPSVAIITWEDIERQRAERAAAEAEEAKRRAEEAARQVQIAARNIQYSAAKRCGLNVPTPEGDPGGFDAQMRALKSDVCMGRALVGNPSAQWKYVKPVEEGTKAAFISDEERRKKLYIAQSPIKTSTIRIMSVGREDDEMYQYLVDLWRKRK